MHTLFDILFIVLIKKLNCYRIKMSLFACSQTLETNVPVRVYMALDESQGDAN